MANSRWIWMSPLLAVCAIMALGAPMSWSAGQSPTVPKLPIGVSPQLYALTTPPAPVPTPEKAALGKLLFHDKRLSSDGTVSCDTCHDVDRGFTDHRPDNATSAGVGGKRGARNSPTVLDAMFQASQFWDGRAATLEEQAKLPMVNPVEMGETPQAIVATVRGIPDYARSFQTLYGHDATYDDIASAIGALSARSIPAIRRSTVSLPATPTPSTPPPSAAGRSSTARRAAPIATSSTRSIRCSPIRSSTTSASPRISRISTSSRARPPRSSAISAPSRSTSSR